MEHTTNYENTFIEVAEDCPENTGIMPPYKKEKSIANIHYELMQAHPYQYTSDDVIFRTFAIRNAIPEADVQQERERFFSKGQACLRTSPLTKRYGWGVHHDSNSKVALIPAGSEAYRQLKADKTLKHVKAMRNKR